MITDQLDLGDVFVRLTFFSSNTDDVYPREPEIFITPAIIDQDEYSVAEIRCTASGSPVPRIQWRRLDGRISSDVVIRDGFLRFNSLRKSDAGSYLCSAENNIGAKDQPVQVFVRGERLPPPVPEEVNVSPSQHTGDPGEEIRLRCSSQPRGRITWTKTGSVELPRSVVVSGEELVIRYSTVDDSGRYICNVQFPSGLSRSGFADVIVVARSNEQVPAISTLERKYSVVQGGDFELTCEATGSPYPTIVWSIVSIICFQSLSDGYKFLLQNGAQFESNARQTGKVLRILNARPENSGVYVCLASNNAGSDQAATIIEVERKFKLI